MKKKIFLMAFLLLGMLVSFNITVVNAGQMTFCPYCGTAFSVAQSSSTHHEGYCSGCGYVAVTRHTFYSSSHVEPTCTSSGKDVQICLYCDYVDTTTIEALGHSYANTWSSDGANHWHKCIRCDAKSGTAAHTGGTATCIAKKVCDTCKASYGEIAANNHDWNAWQADGDKQHKRICKRNNNHIETASHTDTDKNGKCDTCNYIMQVAPTLTISPNPLSIVYGSTGTFTYNYTGDATPTITVGSDKVAKASINTTAKTITVTTVAVGETPITISCGETAKYFAATANATIKVTRQSINLPTGTNYTYDGAQHTGLSATEQYTVGGTYQATNVGSYTATATPTGNYMWSDGNYNARNVSWSITAKSFRDGSITGSLSQSTYEYDKKPKTPDITVKDGDKVLTPGVDYDVRYENNTDVGTAKVVITGKGNYEGTIEKEFTIQDTTPPTPPTITAKLNQAGGENYGSGTWTNQNVHVSLQSTDYSDIQKYQYREGTTGEWKDMPAGGVTLYETEMNQDLYYRAVDKYGNTSEASSLSVRIDKTPPEKGTLKANIRDENGLEYEFGKVTDKSVYLRLDYLGSDQGGSGLKNTTYILEEVDDNQRDHVLRTLATNEKGARTLKESGTYRVVVVTEDGAGNITRSDPYYIIIDRDFTNIIRLNNLYDVGSGIRDITITITKQGESTATYTETISTYEANFVKRVKLPDGTFDVNVVIQDKAGNSKTLTGRIDNVIW